MLKKLILVIMASVLFITGCQAVKGVNLNQMVLNSSKIKSSESKLTGSLDLTYNKANVKDKDFLKVLNILNHAKFDVQAKMKDSNTVSLTGNVTLLKGKIPFQFYMDQKEMVLLLDHATKPIRVPIDNGAAPDDKLIQDLQTKILAPIVNDLPNPPHITVTNTTEKVHYVRVPGYKVHAEIYGNEVASLLLTFLDNLSKDNTAITQIVNAVNDIMLTADEPKMTVDDFKSALDEIKTSVQQSLPELQKDKVLTKSSYLKTDILVNKWFFVRKSSTTLKIANLPDADGLTGIQLKLDNEIWNINQKVNASKIKYKTYLKEDATPEQILSTLDKKHSVLFSVMTSYLYTPSTALKASQVKVTNNKSKYYDKIVVNGVKKGDVIKVYSKTGTMLTANQATGSTVTLYVRQLGKTSGHVYVSIFRAKHAESARVSIAFKAEKK